MLSLFKKQVNLRVLAIFLKNPSYSFYIKQLAKILKISPSSVSLAVKGFEKSGLLTKEIKGLAHLYALNNNLAIVRHLKIVYTLISLENFSLAEKFLEADEGLFNLILYGSYANGSYDNRSDIDLLVISNRDKKIFLDIIRKLEEALKVPINLEVFRLTAWHQLKKQKDIFYKEVMSNHLLLYGSELA